MIVKYVDNDHRQDITMGIGRLLKMMRAMGLANELIEKAILDLFYTHIDKNIRNVLEGDFYNFHCHLKEELEIARPNSIDEIFNVYSYSICVQESNYGGLDGASLTALIIKESKKLNELSANLETSIREVIKQRIDYLVTTQEIVKMPSGKYCIPINYLHAHAFHSAQLRSIRQACAP